LPYDVLVVGRPSCDLVFTGMPSWPAIGRETFAGDLTVAAGGSFNMVAALHRLGLRTAMVGVAGNDDWSRFSLAAMRAEGVSTDLVVVLDRPLPSVSVCIAHDGDRGFLTHEVSIARVWDVVRDHTLGVVAREDAAYLQCWLTPHLPAFAAAARSRRMRVVVDCGWDEAWLVSAEIRALLPLADIVFTNQPEACAIAGTSDPVAALRWLGQNHPFVVVKRGADGASALVEGREYHAPTEPVDVVDATGAGDCFNAGFLYGLRRGHDIDACLALGNICGGMNATVPGGYAGAPTEPELLARAERAGVLPTRTAV